MRACLAAVLAIGCGSVDAKHPDAGPDVPDAPGGPRCDSSQPFLNPTLLPNVNTASRDEAPRLSADELELFFSSDRPGGAGGLDLYVARRASRDADFGAPERIVELSTASSESGPFLAADNLTLYYHPPLEIYVAMRPTRTAPFGVGVPVATINSNADDSEPYLTQNDQVMYFPSSRANGYEIYRSVRSGGAFGTPSLVTELNTATSIDAHPVPSQDDLAIYWGTNRTDGGADGNGDIWIATRPSTSAPFGTPMRHGTLNTLSYDEPGWISADNCVMYLASDRPGGLGGRDIYVARRPR